MKQLCEDHEKYPEPLFGKTSTHEDIMIEIHPDRIITQVFQQNGWVRKNVYTLKRSPLRSSMRKGGVAKRSQKGIET